MERHQRVQKKTVDRSDRSAASVSLLQTPGFGVQQKLTPSTPASKGELWANYQRATELSQNRSIQAKLSIGQPGDKYEQEADSVADRVMAMSEPAQVQREELGEEEEELQMKPLAGMISPLVQREELPQEEEELQMKPEDNVVQREALPEEEEELQMKSLDNSIQREALPEEEEELQMKPEDNAIQREALPEEEEEELQAKSLDNSIQREALPEEEEEIQTKQSSISNTPVSTPALEHRLSSSKGGGNPLSDDVRSFMEPRFGADFSGVRVHTGSDAVQMNQDVNAQAFAHGQDVYFGAGKAPGKDALTAHELTHVVQQTGNMSRSTLRREPVAPSSPNPNSGGLRSKLTKISADLQSFGTTATANKVGDKVLIKSPGVVYDGNVSLAKGVEIGTDAIKVGIIQTITSTNRIGVYRKDGKADGDIITEQRFALGLSPDTSDGNGNNITPVPPFYHSPEELNDNKKTVHVVAQDFPAHKFPETIGEGKLTETKGGDHFTSSLAAKQGSELVHLKDFAWDQDWSMILDANQSGTGKGVTPSVTTTDPETPGGAFGNTGLVNPDNTIDAYMSSAAADAGLLKKGPVLFIQDLPHHQAKAPDSYGLMVGSLLRSPVNFAVKVTVEKTNSIFGKDTINVTASAHTAKTQMLDLNDGESATATLPANSVYNPNQISGSTTVNLWINGESIQWPFPYQSSPSPISVSSGRRGKYKIEYYMK